MDDGLRKRFLDEARALARLAHPNVVRIYELGGEAEEPHFVMEYVQGVPLTQAARRLDMRARWSCSARWWRRSSSCIRIRSCTAI